MFRVIIFSFLFLSASSAVYAHELACDDVKNDVWELSSDLFYGVAASVWYYCPSSKELLYDVGIESVIDVVLGHWTKALGDNPAAKTSVRDGNKILSTYGKVRDGGKVSGTNYTYDEAHIYSQLTKTGTKIAVILLGSKFANYEPKDAAIIANYPGEYFSRIIGKVGEHRQENNVGEVSYFEHFVSEAPLREIAGVGLVEIGAKTKVSNFLSGLVQRTGIPQKASMIVVFLFASATGLPVEAFRDSLATAIRDRGPAAVVFIFSGILTSKLVSGVVTTVLLAPPAKAVVRFVDKTMKMFPAIWHDVILSIYYGDPDLE